MELVQRASLIGSCVPIPASAKAQGSPPGILSNRRSICVAAAAARGGANRSSDDDENEDIEQALNLSREIPNTSDGFLKRVSSRAYDLRSKLEKSLESVSYDVLDSNPWMENSKAVYVLAQKENQLLTMRTRRERSEVERELSMLFPKRGNRRSRNGMISSSSGASSSPFRMQVEDIREGVLVFEDEDDAARYCSLFDGSCRGIAEIEASDVFAMCKKNKALAVLFRRGRIPPKPDRLQKNLNSRNHSLEDN